MLSFVFVLAAPGRFLEPEAFLDVFEQAGYAFGKYAFGLKLNDAGAMEFDSNLIFENASGALVREGLRRKLSLQFRLNKELSLSVSFERQGTLGGFRLTWEKEEYDSLPPVSLANLDALIREASAKSGAAYIIDVPYLTFFFDSYFDFRNGIPTFSVPDQFQGNIDCRRIFLNFTRAALKPEGDNLNLIEVGKTEDGFVEYKVDIGFKPFPDEPDEIRGADPSNQSDPDNEDRQLFMELKLERNMVPEEDPEKNTRLPGLDDMGNPYNYDETLKIFTLLSSTVEADESTSLSAVTDNDTRLRTVSGVNIKFGNSAEEVHSDLLEPPGKFVTLWREVLEETDSNARLKVCVGAFEELNYICQPLALVIYRESVDTMAGRQLERAENKVIEVKNLPDGIASAHMTPTYTNEGYISSAFLQSVVSDSSSRISSSGNSEPLYWREIEVLESRCRLFSAYSDNETSAFTVPSIDYQSTIHCPIQVVNKEHWICGPMSGVPSQSPLGFAMRTYRNIVRIDIAIRWALWSRRSTPEYTALRRVVTAIQNRGWRLDDSSSQLFIQ